MNNSNAKQNLNYKQSLDALNIMSDNHNPYIEYERRKKDIQAKNLLTWEYEQAIIKLTDELKI